MDNGILSQGEIDALLKGKSTSDGEETGNECLLTPVEEDAVGEVGNIGMGTSATTLSTLLGLKVKITTPSISYTSRKQFSSDFPIPYVVVKVNYLEGLSGSNIFIIKKEDASIMADLMMGGEGRIQELNEIMLSAVSEAMNQMMGSSTTSMSSMLKTRINIDPPVLSVIDFSDPEVGFDHDDEFDSVVQVSFRMEIGDLVDSEIMQLIPIASAREMVKSLMDIQNAQREVKLPPPSPSKPVEEIAPLQSEPAISSDLIEFFDEQLSEPPKRTSRAPNEQVAVRPVHFSDLGSPSTHGEIRNIDIILDVPLDISVELGKTKKSIKEILELGPGSIIQLDKLAGEPVDFIVNGKLIAKGEVVVIDENYGLRISAIASPLDRMTKLQ